MKLAYITHNWTREATSYFFNLYSDCLLRQLNRSAVTGLDTIAISNRVKLESQPIRFHHAKPTIAYLI